MTKMYYVILYSKYAAKLLYKENRLKRINLYLFELSIDILRHKVTYK